MRCFQSQERGFDHLISALLQKLISQNLTSVRELCELTGRGESTIYRWLSHESQPTYRDVELIVRKVADPHAREQLVCLLLAGLPVVVEWLEGAERNEEETDAPPEDVTFRLTLNAMQSLTRVLDQERQMLHGEAIDLNTLTGLMGLIDEVIRNLTATKAVLLDQVPRRRRARPLRPVGDLESQIDPEPGAAG